jgi:hypothetical protein
LPVSKRLIILPLNKLDIIVAAETIIEMTPAEESETDKSLYISGHADPNTESGNPKLINDKYTIINNAVNILTISSLSYFL